MKCFNVSRFKSFRTPLRAEVQRSAELGLIYRPTLGQLSVKYNTSFIRETSHMGLKGAPILIGCRCRGIMHSRS